MKGIVAAAALVLTFPWRVGAEGAWLLALDPVGGVIVPYGDDSEEQVPRRRTAELNAAALAVIRFSHSCL